MVEKSHQLPRRPIQTTKSSATLSKHFFESKVLSDGTEVNGRTWKQLRLRAFRDQFKTSIFWKKCSDQDRATLEQLIEAQRNQGDMEPLRLQFTESSITKSAAKPQRSRNDPYGNEDKLVILHRDGGRSLGRIAGYKKPKPDNLVFSPIKLGQVNGDRSKLNIIISDNTLTDTTKSSLITDPGKKRRQRQQEMRDKREEDRWDELTLKQRKQRLRTKSKNAMSSPTASENQSCIDEVPIEIEASQDEDYTGIIGGVLTI